MVSAESIHDAVVDSLDVLTINATICFHEEFCKVSWHQLKGVTGGLIDVGLV